MKSQPIKLGVYKVICLAVKHHGHGPAAQTTIMQSLQYNEHLPEPMAECLDVLLKEFDHAQLGDEILREIAAKSFNAQDTKGPRNFSKFLTQFAEWAPRAVLKQISLLLSHLDSEVRQFLFQLAIFLHANGRTTVLSDANGDRRNHRPSHSRARLLRGPHQRCAPNPKTAQQTLRPSHRTNTRHFLLRPLQSFQCPQQDV